MLCKNCDREFNENLSDCPYCGAVVVKENDTQIMDQADIDGFSGITIDESGEKYKEDNDFKYSASSPNAKIFVKKIDFKSGFLSSLLFVLVAAFLIFIFLPAFLLAFIVFSILWFLYRLFK